MWSSASASRQVPGRTFDHWRSGFSRDALRMSREQFPARDSSPNFRSAQGRWTRADLAGAQLHGCDLAGAEYDARTNFPEGFDPELAGMMEVTE